MMKNRKWDIRTWSRGERARFLAVAGCIGAVLLILLAVVLIFWYADRKDSDGDTSGKSGQVTETAADEDDLSASQISGNGGEADDDASGESDSENGEAEGDGEAQILPRLAELYEQNPDLAGWIQIADTVIDYPVMFTPEDGEKYIYADFEGHFDVEGLPFIEDDCSMDPESDNLIIYGHNMKNGTMFASLMDYADKSYWEEHPVITFSTLYEEREYEIVAAFYDRVYYKYENCFKFYQFIDAEDEEHFAEALTYYKDNALYDTGVSAEYGDRLITLVTCAYHVENGRFVVVARAAADEEE